MPDECSVESIDADLVQRDDLSNLPLLPDEIALCWHSLADFLRSGFAFCLLHQGTLAGWYTSEYVSAGGCGIGVETIEEHQRRGYVSLTASAFVAHCHHLGRLPHWDAWSRNLTSNRLSEKLAFERVCRYETQVLELARG